MFLPGRVRDGGEQLHGLRRRDDPVRVLVDEPKHFFDDLTEKTNSTAISTTEWISRECKNRFIRFLTKRHRHVRRDIL